MTRISRSEYATRVNLLEGKADAAMQDYGRDSAEAGEALDALNDYLDDYAEPEAQ